MNKTFRFLRMLGRSGKVSPRKIHHLIFSLLGILIFSPFDLLERLFFSRKIRKTQLREDPIFILGHWRSGTSWLHQLLGANPEWAYLNYYEATFPGHFLLTERFLKPFFNWVNGLLGLKVPFFNNLKLDLDLPCEEDTALMNSVSGAAAYQAYLYPREARQHFERTLIHPDMQTQTDFERDYQHLLKKLTLAHGGKRLVLKSPPHTLRVKQILKMFPGAKFIYLKRDAKEVLRSHLKLWQSEISMFSYQDLPEEDLRRMIGEVHENFLREFEAVRGDIPVGQLVEVSYASLKTLPREVLEGIFLALDLGDFSAYLPHLERKLEETAFYKPFSYPEITSPPLKKFDVWALSNAGQ
ncbi:MAG: sulfotransferase [Bacteroidia bacterium]|nr:sulfotransferase [Bacteroidia bacterium]